jgi:hypothetical protein
VLVRLDRPVAAYADPVVMRWLETGEAGAGLSAQSRARCRAVWGPAGLIAGASHDLAGRAPGDGDVIAEHAARLAEELPGAVLAVGVTPACSFCAQLAADLAANAAFWERAGFGVVVASQDHARRLGRVPDALVPALAVLACMAARHGTPSGMLLQPGVQPWAVTGYAQVSAALAGMSGPGWNAVIEPPTSCSVTVTSEGSQVAHPLAAGDHIVGVGVRDRATSGLDSYLTAKTAGRGYVPLTLLVDRPGTLYLVYRGGEMIARLRTAAQVAGLLETILAGYASLTRDSPGHDGVPLLCGALLRDDGDGSDVVLVPRSWMSDLVRHQSVLRRRGWNICPDPYIPLNSLGTDAAGMLATVHPAPAASSGRWPARAGRVREILLDPIEIARGRAVPPAQLRAQVVNWVKRPAAAGQVHTLAALLAGVPVRTTACPQLISTINATIP